MYVVFRGDRIELERDGGLSRTSITIEGVTFRLGERTDASGLSPKAQAKLANNHHFEVVAEDGAVAAGGLAGEVASADAESPEPRATKRRK